MTADGQVKALTMRPPWSEWIAQGVKRVENRPATRRPTNHRGPLVIHAGKNVDQRGYIVAADLGLDRNAQPVTTGALVAVAHLVDCHWSGDGRCGESCDGWAEPDAWHWVLSGARRIVPVPWRGQLSLFTVPTNVLRTAVLKGAWTMMLNDVVHVAGDVQKWLNRFGLKEYPRALCGENITDGAEADDPVCVGCLELAAEAGWDWAIEALYGTDDDDEDDDELV